MRLILLLKPSREEEEVKEGLVGMNSLFTSNGVRDSILFVLSVEIVVVVVVTAAVVVFKGDIAFEEKRELEEFENWNGGEGKVVGNLDSSEKVKEGDEFEFGR